YLRICRPTKFLVERSAGGARTGSQAGVDIATCQYAHIVVAHIGDFKGEIPGQRPLQGQVPRLDVAFLSVEWNEKVDLIQRGVGDYAIWGNGRDQRRRKAGCHFTCSAEGIGRRKRVVLLNREIESVLVIREGGVNADPVAAANNGLFIEPIGKSK